MNYNVIVTRNYDIVSQFPTSDYKEAVKEYKRIARNVWRRKSAFCQVEYPLKFFITWNEAHKNEDGYFRFCCEIEQSL